MTTTKAAALRNQINLMAADLRDAVTRGADKDEVRAMKRAIQAREQELTEG